MRDRRRQARTLRLAPLVVRPSPTHGLGVFTRRALRRGALLERGVYLVVAPGAPPRAVGQQQHADRARLANTLPAADRPRDSERLLCHYLFALEDAAPGQPGPRLSALPLGWAALCNHAAVPNARILFDRPAGSYRLVARRALAAGEELTLDYGLWYWSAASLRRRAAAEAIAARLAGLRQAAPEAGSAAYLDWQTQRVAVEAELAVARQELLAAQRLVRELLLRVPPALVQAPARLRPRVTRGAGPPARRARGR